ncbi:unnamed protein product [Ectocarpus sp. CCAP 1310/34]|nr:unnamed protein product [Ectocarpus sp. CCAP 1310/34]
MQPYSSASIASAWSRRILSRNGAFGLSKSCRPYRLRYAHAPLLLWLISGVRSPCSLTRPPRYRNSVFWAYFCPAASTVSGGGVGAVML